MLLPTDTGILYVPPCFTPQPPSWLYEKGDGFVAFAAKHGRQLGNEASSSSVSFLKKMSVLVQWFSKSSAPEKRPGVDETRELPGPAPESYTGLKWGQNVLK